MIPQKSAKHCVMMFDCKEQTAKEDLVKATNTHCIPVMKVNVNLTLQSCTSHYNAGTWGIVQGQLRPLLAPRVYTLPMVRSIGKTMVQGKNYGPQITVKRISTRSVLHRTLSQFGTSTPSEICAVRMV